MRRVILTFDDGLLSQYDFAARHLKEYNQKGTFFVCTRTVRVQSEMQPKHLFDLQNSGFEIGDHYTSHVNITKMEENDVHCNLTATRKFLCRWRINHPESFCPPGFHYNQSIKKILEARNYKYVRLGCNDDLNTFTNGGIGPILDLRTIDPHHIYCTVLGRNVEYQDVMSVIDKLDDTNIAVFCFHDFDDDYVGTSWPKRSFSWLLNHLHRNNIQAINLNELGNVIAGTNIDIQANK